MSEEIKPQRKLKEQKFYWDWSGDSPFGNVSQFEIFGLAICQYDKELNVYRFSCDKNWEIEQDSPHESVEDAMNSLPEQYKNVEVSWIKYT